MSAPVLPKSEAPTFCIECGTPIEQGGRGKARVFCSSTCQGRRWVKDHPGETYRKRARAWARSSAQERAEGRRRAAARSRALADLAAAYPDEYRHLYDLHLADPS